MKWKPKAVNVLRKAMYCPLECLSELPGGPLRYMWIVRLVVKLDAPLRRFILEGANDAKSTG